MTDVVNCSPLIERHFLVDLKKFFRGFVCSESMIIQLLCAVQPGRCASFSTAGVESGEEKEGEVLCMCIICLFVFRLHRVGLYEMIFGHGLLCDCFGM